MVSPFPIRPPTRRPDHLVVDAAAKAHLCQVVRILRVAHQRLLRRQPLLEVASSLERVGHFAERNLDRFFVSRHRCVTRHLGRHAQSRPNACAWNRRSTSRS